MGVGIGRSSGCRAKGADAIPQDPFFADDLSFEKIRTRAIVLFDLSRGNAKSRIIWSMAAPRARSGEALNISHRTAKVHRARTDAGSSTSRNTAAVSEIWHAF